MKSVRRFAITLLTLCLLMTVPVGAPAEGSSVSLVGEWVFSDMPGTTLMYLKEDGSAIYGGQSLVWEDQHDALLLTDEAGESLRLPYLPTGTGITVWLPSVFERISEIGGVGEITGTWRATGNSQSSFVFTLDGQFLEDGIFSGTYTVDEENATVKLQYSGPFADTEIFYVFMDEALVIYYPWALSLK